MLLDSTLDFWRKATNNKAYDQIMGICLGHQLVALAVGAKTIKLKVGFLGVTITDLPTDS